MSRAAMSRAAMAPSCSFVSQGYTPFEDAFHFLVANLILFLGKRTNSRLDKSCTASNRDYRGIRKQRYCRQIP